jgi:hypothetical protein
MVRKRGFMKSILKTVAVVTVLSLMAAPAAVFADTHNDQAPGANDQNVSKSTQNTPAGPTSQGDTGTTGTPEQTKTGDTATTDKMLSNGAPNEATKKNKKKHHHSTSSAASQTNTAPATTKP